MQESSVRSGLKVSFKLREAVCPDQTQIMNELTPDLEVSGKIAYFSDSGEQQDHFAIVDVPGAMSPLIVPVERLNTMTEAEERREARR